MAISLQGTPTSAQGDGSTATVNVPTVSGGIQDGDLLLVLFACCESEDNTSNVPSGMDGEWIAEYQVGQSPPSVPGMQLWYEWCSGGESGTRSTALSFTSGWMMIAWVLRGVDPTTPLDVSITQVQSTSTGLPNPPPITPTSDDCMIAALGLKDETGADNLTSDPTNYTGLGYENNNQSTGGTLMAAYRLLSGGSGSPEDPSAWVTTGGNDEWCACTVAFRPAPTSQTYDRDASDSIAVTDSVLAQKNYKIEGVTYSNIDSSILGSVDCYLYKDNLDNTLTFIDHVVSDPSTGAYQFEWIPDSDAQYLVVGIKDDSPHVFDVTDHVLDPLVVPTESYDLYLWSDTEKGETSPDNDLRLRPASARGVVARRIFVVT